MNKDIINGLDSKKFAFNSGYRRSTGIYVKNFRTEA